MLNRELNAIIYRARLIAILTTIAIALPVGCLIGFSWRTHEYRSIDGKQRRLIEEASRQCSGYHETTQELEKVERK